MNLFPPPPGVREPVGQMDAQPRLRQDVQGQEREHFSFRRRHSEQESLRVEEGECWRREWWDLEEPPRRREVDGMVSRVLGLEQEDTSQSKNS